MKFASSLYSFLAKNSYLLPLFVAGLTVSMLLLTLLPSNFLGESKLWSYDKLGHSFLFGAWCLSLGLYYQIGKASPVNPWIILASGTLFGILIEVLQYLLPLNRHADPVDVLFDVLGCLIATWILKFIQPESAERSAETSSA